MKKRASIFLEFSKIYFLLNKLDIHLLLLLNFNKPHFKIFLRYLNIHFILTGQSLRACVLSCFCHVQLFVTLWTVVHQDPLSMGFSRQEYWRELACPLPGDLPQAFSQKRKHKWSVHIKRYVQTITNYRNAS